MCLAHVILCRMPKMRLFSSLIIFVLLFLASINVIFAQGPTFNCFNGFSQLFPGITYKEESTISPRTLKWFIVKADLNDPNIDLTVTPRDGLGVYTSTFLLDNGASVAVNGDYSIPGIYDPLGLATYNGDVYSDASGEPSIYISQDNGVTFFNEPVGFTNPGNQWSAISGGHTLVKDGVMSAKINNCEDPLVYCTNLHPRTAIAKASNNTLLLMVVDSPGVTLKELADMMLNCQAESAINMDGGGSSTLVTSENGHTIKNNPSDGAERKVANHLGVCAGDCVGAGIQPPQPTPAQVSGEARPRFRTGSAEYPFPCNAVAPEDSSFTDEEFHSLRPYQASPCNPNKEDLALFCGNDLVLSDSVSIVKNFGVAPNPTPSYTFGGSDIEPNPPFDPISNACHYCDTSGQCVTNTEPCIPDADQCATNAECGGCLNIGEGIESCSFTISGDKSFSIDISGAKFPVMGYTEPSIGNTGSGNPSVINQYNGDETLTDNDKINEYVSWYLNGVINKAEYPPMDADNDCIGQNTGSAGKCLELNENGVCMERNPFFIPPTHPNDDLTVDQSPMCLTPAACCVSGDPVDILDRDKVINYSGPIRKLLPFTIQSGERIREVDSANRSRTQNSEERHDEIVGRTPLFTINLPFIGPVEIGERQLRLSGWNDHKPPLEEDYIGQDYSNFLSDYYAWRGLFCFKLTIPFAIFGNRTVFWCFDDPLNPNFWSNFFSNVLFSSTEDRLGEINVKSSSYSFASPEFRLISVDVSNVPPADMFIPHMEEGRDLADALQNTYIPEGADKDNMTDATFIPESPYCDIVQARTNPGDDIFAGGLSGSVSYTAQVACNFYVWGNGDQQPNPAPYGNLCQKLAGGTCIPDPFPDLYTEVNYGRYDCDLGYICVAGEQVTLISHARCDGYGICVPTNFNSAPDCTPIPNTSCNPSAYFKCVNSTSCQRPVEASPSTQSCSTFSYINMGLETQTPLADNIWSRLVAGSSSVFRRIFPKVASGSAVSEIWDIPGSTSVNYTSSDGTVYAGNPGNLRSGSGAQLYFPHIGGIKEYFLTGIQGILRPKGYGYQILSDTSSAGVGTCTAVLPNLPPVQDCQMCSKYDSWMPPLMKQIFESAASYYDVPANLLVGVFYNEGGFDRFDWTDQLVLESSGPNCQVPNCYSYNVSQSGAAGPWQFLPTGWKTGPDAAVFDNGGTGINDGRIPDRCNLLDSTFAAARKLLNGSPGWDGYTAICNPPGYPTCEGVRLNTGTRTGSGCSWSDSDIITAARQYLGYCDSQQVCEQDPRFGATPWCEANQYACYETSVRDLARCL